MAVLWVEDNFPQIADVVESLEKDLSISIHRECHVTDAFELLKNGRQFSAIIIDIMLPLGGLNIPTELLKFREKYDMARDTEFSGVLLAEYIVQSDNHPPVVVLSDFCNLASELEKRNDNVHLFYKQEIDEYMPRFTRLISEWV